MDQTTQTLATQPEGVDSSDLQAKIYNIFVDSLTPHEVSLVSLNFEISKDMALGPYTSEATQSVPTVETSENEKNEVVAIFAQEYKFKIVGADDNVLARGMATFRVKITSSFPNVPLHFWSMFKVRNIRLYTQPPLRDLVASLCARAGIQAAPLPSVAVTQTYPSE